MDNLYSGLGRWIARNYRGLSALMVGKPVHRRRQLQIQLGHAPGIMGVQRDLYA
jgi:hypothetical protein